MIEATITRALRTPVYFIVHTLQQVNDALAHGRFFFMDIARDGIAMYQADETPLHSPKPKTPADAAAMAKEYFEEWFPSSIKRFEGAQFYLSKGHRRRTVRHRACEKKRGCRPVYRPH